MKQHKPSIKESLDRWEEAPQQGPGEAEQVKLNRWGQKGSQAAIQTQEMTNYKTITGEKWTRSDITKLEKNSSRKQNKVTKGSKDSKHLNEAKLSELNAGSWQWEEIMDDSKFSCLKL